MNTNSPYQYNNLMRLIISGVLFVLLSACGTVQVGQDFDVEAFEEIARIGETSKAEVRKALGAPKGTGIALEKNGERLDEWLYFSGTGSLPGMSDTTIKMLQIRFDQAGVMRSYNWSYSK